MRLIGVTGRKESGKNAVSQFIAEWAESRGLTVVQRGFADKLKHSAFLALGFQIEESDAVALADDLKSVGEITTSIPGQSVLYTISGRKFLQLYGTEAHREVFHDNFWVDALLPRDHVIPGSDRTTYYYWHKNFSGADIAVVTDVRFKNEADRIVELGGSIIEVDRPSLGENEDTHASEQPLPISYIDAGIRNEGTLDDLRAKVYKIMDARYG